MPTKVAVFNFPGLNGSGVGDYSDENSNLLSIVQKQIDEGKDYAIEAGITSFTMPDLATRLADASFFFMPDMERQDPTDNGFLPESAVTILRNFVEDGGVMVMTGTGGNKDVEFLNRIFSWDLATVSSGNTNLNVANAADTPFAGGPATLNTWAAETISGGTVSGFTPIYGDSSAAAVAVVEAGQGTVILLTGSDYFAMGFATDWGEGLHANGYGNTSDWATTILPRALEYAADLSEPSAPEPPAPEITAPEPPAPEIPAPIGTVVLSLNFPLTISGFGQPFKLPTTSTTIEMGGLQLGGSFDESFYLKQNRDVAAAVAAGDFATGYDHFIAFGLGEGRSSIAYFDSSYYLAQNADVAAAVERGEFKSGIEHFFLFGHKENRNPSALFDCEDYLTNNPDVAAAVKSGAFDSAFEHFVQFGAMEGRLSYSLFQEDDYLNLYSDVKAAVEKGEFASGWQHFQIFGMAEGRQPSDLFSEDVYLEANPDVAAAKAAGGLNGVQHFFVFGYSEGRNLS